MKTNLVSLLLAAALASAPVLFASGPSTNRATATVELTEPEKFTDFKLSPMGRGSDVQYLSRELQREINRLAGNILPAGYHAILRIRDVDMAGDFEPQRRPPHDQIRIMRSVYTPKITLEFSVTDEAGNVVAAGERRLTDLAYDMRLRTHRSDPLEIETDLVGDLFRSIAHADS